MATRKPAETPEPKPARSRSRSNKKPVETPEPIAAETSEPIAAEPVAAPPSSFDVVGEDGRRIVRGYALVAAEDLIRRIRLSGSEEKLKVVPSPEA